MKVLLVHPEDNLDTGPWLGQKWGRVIDLGMGGALTYQRWERNVGCPVVPLGHMRNGFEEFHRVRELMNWGQGRLKDRHGLDWWELTAMFFHQQMEALVVLQKLVSSIDAGDEVFVTRPCFHADALKILLGGRFQCLVKASSFGEKGLRHYARVASKFPLAQLAEIFWDKYDAAYAIRGRVQRGKRRPSGKPVVLLPSAYVNVSRTGIAYARTSPETDFLLVSTRRSGEVAGPPKNVAVASLASFVPRESAESERDYEDLIQKWRVLRHELAQVPELALLERMGLLNAFPKYLRQGLAIRDAWREVLDTEPVKAVLCGDDSNPYTHIPLILAGSRGIPTLSCHHGALDGRQLIKQSHADVVLAKGKMEADYLVNTCGLPASEVEIGAPVRPAPAAVLSKSSAAKSGSCIVIFSEAYEVGSGRALEFYRDLLPPMANLALETGRKLVIKLHPFESVRERRTLVKEVLSAEQRRVTTVASGPLTNELLDETWFGVTVISTVAVECAIRGIPCFLCQWLECWPYGYIRQFSRFGVGMVLQSVHDFSTVKERVEGYVANPQLALNLWQIISPRRFRELIANKSEFDQALAI